MLPPRHTHRTRLLVVASLAASAGLLLSPSPTRAGLCDPNHVIDQDNKDTPLRPMFVFQHDPRWGLKNPLELELLDNKSGKTIDTRVVAGPLKSDHYFFYQPVKPLLPNRSYVLRAKRQTALTMLLFRTASRKKRSWSVTQPRSPRLTRTSRVRTHEGSHLRLTLKWAKAVRGPMKVVIKSTLGLAIVPATKVGRSTYDIEPVCGPIALDVNRSSQQTIQVALLGPTGNMSAFYKVAVRPGN